MLMGILAILLPPLLLVTMPNSIKEVDYPHASIVFIIADDLAL